MNGEAWYNDNDPHIVAWLRELIRAGQIPSGIVDERSIKEVCGVDPGAIAHFFAGIGGWSHALGLAGWPAEAPVWTGSCPCQPFSTAGKGEGFDDERHLWPVWKKLIAECRPPVIFGEQVASHLGRKWFARVRSDLEALGYAVGASDLCAAGIGAPQIRQRIFWVADSDWLGRRRQSNGHAEERPHEIQAPRPGSSCRLADTKSAAPRSRHNLRGRQSHAGENRGMGDADRKGFTEGKQASEAARYGSSSFTDGGAGFWSNYDLVPCSDGKARRIEPGTFPVADGVRARVGRLRGYGNSIVPQVAAVFVGTYLEARAIEENP